MPKFEYSAYDRGGQPHNGEIEAESRETAIARLNEQGLFPLTVGEARARARTATARSTTRSPRPADVTLFTQELSVLVSAGQTLSSALASIEADQGAPRLQALAGRLRSSIAGGSSLAEAMAEIGDSIFPPIYVGMIKVAEASGTLGATLERIADAREREERLRAKVTSALLYPSMLVVLAIGAVVLMMVVVVPKFKSLIGTDVERLPAGSRAILGASDWLAANGEVLAIATAALIGGGVLAQRSATVRAATERMLARLPLVGTLLRYALTVRFCRTLGVLLASGLRLPAALALLREVIGSDGARRLIDDAIAGLRQGGDFSETLRRSDVLPGMVTSLLAVGAASGTMSQSALRLADVFESKLEIAIQRLLSLLEPAIILTVSVFTGFIVLSIMGIIVSVYDLTGS